MKNENRVRAKGNAAKVPAQTENPTAKKPVPYELGAAMRCLEENYQRAAALRLYEADACFRELYFLARHHPKLTKATASLHLITLGVQTLDHWCSMAEDIRRGARSSKLRFDHTAMLWFSDYYGAIRELSFLEAAEKLSGFLQWINDSAYNEIQGAIIDINLGKSGMSELCREVDAL